MMFTAQEISEVTGFPTHQQLKEWCEANAEGRLLILPCTVGDTVYCIRKNPFANLRSKWRDVGGAKVYRSVQRKSGNNRQRKMAFCYPLDAATRIAVGRC